MIDVAALALESASLTPVRPIVIVLIVLAAAVLCIALGTFRGSWRVWLVGYALAVAALVLAYGGVRREQRTAAAPAAAAAPALPAPAAPAPIPAPATMESHR